VRGLHNDTSPVQLHAIHAPDGILRITVIVKLHEGISLLEVAGGDLAILAEDVLNVPLAGAVR